MIVLIPILMLIVFLLGYEFYAAATHRKLVTGYFRDAFKANQGPFALVIFIMGVLFGHFFWAM